MTNKLLNIGVLMGGLSIEREVSFNSGRTICDHLDTSRYKVIPLFQDADGSVYILPLYFLHRGKIEDFQSRLKEEAQLITWDQVAHEIDFIYVAVHGRFAEDGTLQGLLEILGVPYLGAKVFGSALGMNKAVHKSILKQAGISVPHYLLVSGHDVQNISQKQLEQKLKKASVKPPYVIKPSHEGSSFGITVLDTTAGLVEAVTFAATIDSRMVQDVLIEEKISGMEFVNVSLERVTNSDGVITSEWFSLPPTEVIPEEGTTFFDYDQKYMPGRCTKITPARCSKDVTDAIAATCHKVAEILHFQTVARIDGIVKEDGEVVIFDPNSLTGMGPATFLFHQAAEYGMSHSQLINYMIDTELKRYGLVNEKISIQGAQVAEDAAMNNKLKVGVLLGGNSNEREISLESGRNVCYKLAPQKYDAIPIFVDEKLSLYKLSQKLLVKNSTREIQDLVSDDIKMQWSDLPNICDFVFIALHGGLGENGSVQGLLEMLGIPYNGSGIFTSALCMDKYKTNLFLASKGFDVPNALLVEIAIWQQQQDDVINKVEQVINFPCIIKPFDDGCSVLVFRATNKQDLKNHINELFKQGKTAVLVEELVTGMELTCGVYGNDEVVVMPPSQAIAKDNILSIKEKFLPGDGTNITPAALPEGVVPFVKEIIASSYKQLGCKGYARIDCFYQNAEESPTGKQRLVLLEVNSLPGLTPATCLFHQAAEIGLQPMDLIDKIVDLGLVLHGKNPNTVKSLRVQEASKQDNVVSSDKNVVSLGINKSDESVDESQTLDLFS